MATHDHDFAVTAGARVVRLSDGLVVDPDDFDPDPDDPDYEYDEDSADESDEYLAEEPGQAGRDR
jgi:hypothetical protein